MRSAHFCAMKIIFFFFLLIENTTPHIYPMCMCMCIYINSRSSSSSSSSSSSGGGGARAAFLLILSLFVRRRKSQRNSINYNLFYAYSILSSLFFLSLSLFLSIRVLSLYLNRIGCIFFCLDAKSSAESLRFIRWNDLRCNSYKSLNALTYSL